jgi:hypothetical protein
MRTLKLGYKPFFLRAYSFVPRDEHVARLMSLGFMSTYKKCPNILISKRGQQSPLCLFTKSIIVKQKYLLFSC